MAYNKRYVAYAKVHGKTPEEMLADEPSMVNFMLWIRRWCVEYQKANPEGFAGYLLVDQKGFTEYLSSVAEQPGVR